MKISTYLTTPLTSLATDVFIEDLVAWELYWGLYSKNSPLQLSSCSGFRLGRFSYLSLLGLLLIQRALSARFESRGGHSP